MRKCWRCQKEWPDTSKNTFCSCDALMPDYKMQVLGTRDGFGVAKAFYSNSAKKEITTWKEWEKAGYKDPLHEPMPHTLREKVKEKMAKEKFYKDRPHTDADTAMPGN